MRKIIVTILLALISLMNQVAFAQYGGGNGDAASPYVISTNAHFQYLANNSSEWSSHFVLQSDLDLTGVSVNPIGDPSNPFIGNFDGDNYVISGYSLNIQSTTSPIGVFGVIGGVVSQISYAGVVQNVILHQPSITVGSGVLKIGSLAGQFDVGNITNCTVIKPTITGGNNTIGGMLGESKGLISQCAVIDALIEPFDGAPTVGGFIGHVHSAAQVYQNYVTGSIRFDANSQSPGVVVGGFLGSANANAGDNLIEDNFCIVNIVNNGVPSASAGMVVGGFIGSASNGNTFIRRCYSVGNLPTDSGFNVGGFVGDVNGVSFTSCYWDKSLNPNLFDTGDSSDGDDGAGDYYAVFGLPTSNMKQQATFTNWDFTNIWEITENVSYPNLISVGEYDCLSCIGDVQGNGSISSGDITEIILLFNNAGMPFIPNSSPLWNPCADLNFDGIISSTDLTILVGMLNAAPVPFISCP